MKRQVFITVGLALVLLAAGAVRAQEPPGGRGAGGEAATGRGAGVPAIPQVSRNVPIDQAAHDAGRALWSMHCVNCHGSQARGSEAGPNIIRTETVNYERSGGLGSRLGPFLKKGHPTQSGKASASFTDLEAVQLANFLMMRVNETMRGSPTYIVLPENILTGDAKAGEAFFKGPGGCTECHNATTRSLAGIASRITSPQALQARVVYPSPAGAPTGRGGGGRRGAAPAAAPANPTGPQRPNPLLIQVTITPASGPAMTGTLVEQDAWTLTYADEAGVLRTIRKDPSVKIVSRNPMQWHLDFVDRIRDRQMHDLTAYLWSLK